MLTIRGLKSAKERKAFKELQREALKAGLKTDLPTTVKVYKAGYTGRKVDASSDYYFNWTKQIGKFYERLARRVKKKVEANDINVNPRWTFGKRRPTDKEGVGATLSNLVGSLRTLVNVGNPQYLDPNMKRSEIDKLVTSRDEEGNVLQAGFKNTKRNPITLKTFGGSSIRLWYNNYMYSLTQLGYTKTLNTLVEIGPEKAYEIYKANAEALEAVFVYSFTGSGSDEAFNAIFRGDQDYNGADEDPDWY